MKRTLICALCAVLTVSPLVAGWDEGVAAYNRGNYRAAVNQFRIVVQQYPDDSVGHHMLGLSYMGLFGTTPQVRQALPHLRTAYQLNPRDAALKVDLAQAYYFAQQYEQAQRMVNSISNADLRQLDAQRATSVSRIRENLRIARRIQQIEQENQQIRNMEEERRKLEAELKGLGTGTSPP